MDDIIIALSTQLGNSAINIVRLSGKGSIQLVNNYFVGKDLNIVDSNTINYGKIKNEDEIIDEVLVSVFKEGKSFTKEEVVEINTHGGILCSNKIIGLFLEKGARLAEPGEFTKRAFLNGRIDLIEAESIMDLINSDTESSRKLSLNGINGNISDLIRALRSMIVEVLGNIEVNIDYPEYDDIEEMTIDLLKEKIDFIESKFQKLLKDTDKTQIVKEGVNVAIVGRPNVGKSSILNKLIGEEKAIVTNIEGTTRDIVEGSIILNNVKINFVDTAGIRDTDDEIEKIGVIKSKKEIEKSDLVLLVLSNNQKITSEDRNMLELLKNKKKIIVINKSDLERKIEEVDDAIFVNTKEEDGLLNLEKEIIRIFNLGELEKSKYCFLNNERQISILKESYNILNEIKKGIELNSPIDMIEIDIKRLWDKLGEILGESYKEELLDEIFSKFCLGK